MLWVVIGILITLFGLYGFIKTDNGINTFIFFITIIFGICLIITGLGYDISISF